MIVPIYDSEDELWFAGTRTGLQYGPMSQRGEFYAWPAPNGSTVYGAEAYQTRDDAERASLTLQAMSNDELHKLSPDYYDEPDEALNAACERLNA